MATRERGGTAIAMKRSAQLSSEFGEFYERKSAEVYRTLAVVIRDSDLAHEATDEAMVRAYESWKKISRYDNPSGWVYRVALNWARSRMRKRHREVHELPVWATTDNLPDPDLDVAIAHLPLPHREVVVLRYLVDMTQDEISEFLEIPVGTVKSRLGRALSTLRAEVQDEH
jgi:RNA polymerase sigma factor (sigma-70 family)